jgi:hypothetical protein
MPLARLTVLLYADSDEKPGNLVVVSDPNPAATRSRIVVYIYAKSPRVDVASGLPAEAWVVFHSQSTERCFPAMKGLAEGSEVYTKFS